MKKTIKVFSLIIFSLIILGFKENVSASSATFSVRSSASTVAVGNNVTVTVTLSSSSALGSWNFTIGYDTSKLRLISSTAERDQTSAGVVSSANQKSVSYKYNFKTLKSGTANVNISDAIVYDFNDEKMSLNRGSVNITLKTWEQIEASYSTNANLKSITIDGGELNPNVTLNPVFNKDTLEYSIELEPNTTEISINATKEDGTASISGLGTITVSEGANKIEIKVTAQKGNTKTYIINATVKELEPINVTVDGKDYVVVRKVDSLVKPYSYSDDTVLIHEKEVPAFYSSITGYKLVGLKDNAGNIKLFIYDEAKDTYKYYQELSLGKVVLATLSIPDDKIIKDYTKSKININNEEVECLVHDEFGITLVYGKNIETGKTNYYIYEKEENTLQRYDEDIFKKINNKINLYTYIILGSGGVIILLIIILIVAISKSKKKLNSRKEEMRQDIIDNENMAKLEEINKKEKKNRDKELKKKQKELEELERTSKEKIEKQEEKEQEIKKEQPEEVESIEDISNKKLSRKERKALKKQEKLLKKKKDVIEEQVSDSKEEIGNVEAKEEQTIQEFELEPKNDEVPKKDKKKHKRQKEENDDDMFML